MSGSSTRPAPAGAGTPVKKRMVQAGTSALSSLVLKRASRSAMQALNSSAAAPADPAGLVHGPDIEDHRRRHAERDEVGERIELRAELAGAVQQARDPAVQRVEHRGDDDGDDGQLPLAAAASATADGSVESISVLASSANLIEVSPAHKANRVSMLGISRLIEWSRNLVRRMALDPPTIEPAAAGSLCRRLPFSPSLAGSSALVSASTVSPATARCPTQTSGETPSGR